MVENAQVRFANMSWLRTIARDSSLGYIGGLAVIALTILSKVLLARALSPDDLGILITGQSFMVFAVALSQLSLPDAVVYFVSQHAPREMAKAKGVLLKALRLSLLLSCLMVCAIAFAAGFIANDVYDLPTLSAVLICLAAAMPFTSATDVMAAGFRGLTQLWVKVIAVDLTRVICLVFVLTGMMSLRVGTLPWVASSYVVASVVAALLTLLIFLRNPSWRVQASSVRCGDLLRYSVPLLSAGLLAGPMVNSGLPLMLGRWSSARNVAYYSIALSLQMFIYMPVSVLEQAALPVWSRRAGGNTQLGVSFAYLTRWIYAAASILFALLFLNARTILTVLYGAEYAVAERAVQILAVVALLGVAVGPNEGALRALGCTQWILATRLVSGVFSVMVALASIPSWGLLGGVAAFVVSSVLVNGFYAIYLFRQHHIHPLDSSYVKTLLASMMCVFLTGLLPGDWASGITRIAATAVIYPALLLVLLYVSRSLNQQDRRLLNRFCRGIRTSL